jgi:hypothetical protein
VKFCLFATLASLRVTNGASELAPPSILGQRRGPEADKFSGPHCLHRIPCAVVTAHTATAPNHEMNQVRLLRDVMLEPPCARPVSRWHPRACHLGSPRHRSPWPRYDASAQAKSICFASRLALRTWGLS